MTENTTPQYTPGGSPAGTYTTPLEAPPATPGYFQTPPPAPKKQAWFKKPIVLLPVGALLLGLAIGSANTPEPETVEVTKEVPGPERTVTKEVEVPTTPASCLEALDINEQAFTLLSASLSSVLDADYAAANAATEKVKALVPKVNAAKADCRAAQ